MIVLSLHLAETQKLPKGWRYGAFDTLGVWSGYWVLDHPYNGQNIFAVQRPDFDEFTEEELIEIIEYKIQNQEEV